MNEQAESLLVGVLCLVAAIYAATDVDGSMNGVPQSPYARYSIHGGHVTPQSKAAANSLAAVIFLMCAAVSGMLLFGVVKAKPSYLMPFFWIKLCDFFFTLPTFLSTLYGPHHGYGHHPPPSLQASFDSGAHTPNPGLMDVRKVFPSGSIGTHSLLVSTCVVLSKGYFLCVVWKCYRYLKMREMILPLHLHSSSIGVCPALSRTDGGHLHSTGNHDVVIPPGLLLPSDLRTVTVSPPDYETATKTNGVAPPDYETAIRQQQEQENKIQEQRQQQFLQNQQQSPPNTLLPPTSVAVTIPSSVSLEPPSPAAASCSSAYSGSCSPENDHLDSIAVSDDKKSENRDETVVSFQSTNDIVRGGDLEKTVLRHLDSQQQSTVKELKSQEE